FGTTDLFKLVDHAKHTRSTFLRDGRVREEKIQHAPAGEANLIVGDTKSLEAVAYGADDLRIGHFRLHADGVNIELHEFPIPAGAPFVGATHRGDHVIAE